MVTTEELKQQFHTCHPLFIALGDKVRLTIVETLSSSYDVHGLNVKEITKKTNLSRPAVSHHLKILKDAGLIQMRKEKTSNYYYLAIAESTKQLMLLGHQLTQALNLKA